MKVCFSLLLLSLMVTSYAQDLIRFSGVVIDDQEYEPVAGTTILNRTSGGGAVSDSLGFFTVKAKPGDTLVFNDVRYLSSVLVIPEVLDKDDYGIIQLMSVNTHKLEEVRVYSFPTEEEFKQAFLDADPPSTPDLNVRAVEAQQNLMQTIKETYENEKYYYDMWADRRLYELTGDIPPNNFLNPFRWTEFVNSHVADD